MRIPEIPEWPCWNTLIIDHEHGPRRPHQQPRQHKPRPPHRQSMRSVNRNR